MDKFVAKDDHDVYRVGKTRVMLDGIVHAFREGCNPEAIRERYISLTLAEAYGAIAFYLANQAEVDQYMKEQHELWEKLRAEQEANPPPIVQRLREIKKARSESTA